MSVVALEERWNGQDDDEENYKDNSPKSVIKRKVRRTKIKSEIHGEEDREFSPVRSGSPYSDFNFNQNFANLQAAVGKESKKERYLAITDVFATPTPAIRPDEEFRKKIAEENKSRKKVEFEEEYRPDKNWSLAQIFFKRILERPPNTREEFDYKFLDDLFKEHNVKKGDIAQVLHYCDVTNDDERYDDRLHQIVEKYSKEKPRSFVKAATTGKFGDIKSIGGFNEL